MVRRRRRGEDPRAPGVGDRARFARQEQAAVHPPRRCGQLRYRGERGEGSRHGQEGRAEGVQAALGLPGRHEGDQLRADARAPPRGNLAQGRLRDDAEEPARPPADEEVEDLRGARASARRSEPAAIRGGVSMADTLYKGTGRRKTAVARVRLLPGDGRITVNGRDYQEYFPRPAYQKVVSGPLRLLQSDSRYDVVVRVEGGGPTGQADAVRHGI